MIGYIMAISSQLKRKDKMAKVKPEWIEAVVQAIVDAYKTGKIQTLEDLEAIARQARDSLTIEDLYLRGATIQAMRNDERVRSIIAELRRKKAEANRPITVDSPLTHLPLSQRVMRALRRNHLFFVRDILRVLHEEKEKRRIIRRLQGIGKESLEEVLSALEWARVEFPSNEGVSVVEGTIHLEEGQTFQIDLSSDFPIEVGVISEEGRRQTFKAQRFSIKIRG